ncbi:MAG: AbrB/MazE/SpoVT family DNA-binding domain-containing protein [Candidatus Binatia bacterium]
MALTKVGPKYQVKIPKAACNAVGLNVGDFVEATATKDGVLLRPRAVVDKSALVALQKQAKRSGKNKLSLREINEEIAAVRTEKAKRFA